MAVQVPLIDAAGISAALPMAACIDAMENALRAFDNNTVAQPLRSVIHLPDRSGSLYTMPAFIAEPRALAVKLITIFHGNEGGSLPTHQGIVVVFDPRTGAPSLLLDAARLTAIRTAAVSAVAARALAGPDAAVLAVLGTGVQARSHIEALPLVRPIREVRVWGRSRERAEQLARDVQNLAITGMHASTAARPGASLPPRRPEAPQEPERSAAAAAPRIIVCDDAEDAVVSADIVCTATSAREPVLRGRWLKAGAHVNAIGASTPDAREVDSATIRLARVFVDSIDAALTEAGDLLIPMKEGVTRAQAWTPVGAVLNRSVPGRQTADEITLFKSVGLAIEDAAAAAHIARQLAASAAEA